MKIEIPPYGGHTVCLPLLAILLGLSLAGCDDGRSTWDDLEEHGIEDSSGQGVGEFEKSVRESTTGETDESTGSRAVAASDITAYGMEADRAEVMAEVVNESLDTLQALTGYEDWQRSRLNEGPANLFVGSPESERGIARLSDEDILAWGDLQHEMIDYLYKDKAACADFVQGSSDLSTVVDLHNRMSVERVRERTRLHLRGLRADLSADGSLPGAPQRARGATLGSVLMAVDEAEGRSAGDRFQVLLKTADKTDAELCELTRTMLRYLPDLQPYERLVILFNVTR